MNTPFTPLTLEQAEDHVGQIILSWPSVGGCRETELQKAELAGVIETMKFFGIIKESMCSVLNAIYVQGWSKKEALRQFGNLKKIPTCGKKKAEVVVNQVVNDGRIK